MYKEKDIDFWECVVFSDETTFTTGCSKNMLIGRKIQGMKKNIFQEQSIVAEKPSQCGAI